MSESLTTTTTNYIMLKEDAAALRESFQANIGTSGIGEFELDTLRVPSGGGRTWQIPGLDNEEAKSVEGIIVHWSEPRAYWKEGLETSGGGSPPDCSSPDGVRGTGTPGGICEVCPMNQWQSAEKGEGKACKQTRVLMLMRPESRLPLRVVVPPSSLKPIRSYFLRLASGAIPYYAVVTKLELQSQRSKGGITYSEIVPSKVERLAPADVDRVRAFSQAFGSMMQRAASSVGARDVSAN